MNDFGQITDMEIHISKECGNTSFILDTVRQFFVIEEHSESNGVNFEFVLSDDHTKFKYRYDRDKDHEIKWTDWFEFPKEVRDRLDFDGDIIFVVPYYNSEGILISNHHIFVDFKNSYIRQHIDQNMKHENKTEDDENERTI
ncbi:MAG: hypothetical protein PHC62_00875 [Candidatus Izemoplasmatales bacterium]|nr:hypothetical protein [Candidatus Izemoplasmatales bacterium]